MRSRYGTNPTSIANGPTDKSAAANYTQLLAKAYNAIKAANPGTMVDQRRPRADRLLGRCRMRGEWLQ